MFLTKRLYLTVLFLFTIQFLCGQVIITGQIRDENAQVLPNINILIYPANTRVLVAYGISGNDGRFSITSNVKADSLDVATSAINYKKSVKRICNKRTEIPFVLKSDVKQLEAFTVKASPIEKRGDTLSYLVSAFSRKKDRTIEDVIKRMPGIEVEKNGKILYQGLPIQKFYVEGLDLMDGRYSVVSSNLPQSSVATVEIYENHQPLKILEDKVSSQQASLNLKLTRNIVTTGTGQIGAGLNPLLWSAKLTPMTFTRNLQLLSSYQTNNIGEDVSKQLRTLNRGDILRNIEYPGEMRKYLGIYSSPFPEIEENRFLDNNIHLLNFNGLTKSGKDQQIRVNLFYINDYQKYESNLERRIFLMDDTLEFNESIKNRYFNQALQGDLSFEKNAKANYLNNKFSFRADWNKHRGTLNNSNGVITQKLNDPLTFLFNDLVLIHPFGKNLVEFSSHFSLDNRLPNLLVNPGSFTLIFNKGQSYEATLQNVAQKQFFTDHSAGVLISKGLFMINAKLGIAYLTQTLESDLAIVNEGLESNPGTDYLNDQESSRVKVYTRLGVEFKKSGIVLKGRFPVSWQNYAIEDHIRDHEQSLSGLLFDPGISAYFKFRGLWTFQGAWSYTNRIGEEESQNYGFVLSNFQNLIRNNAPVSKSSGSRYMASIAYQNPINSLFGSIHYMYSNSSNNLIYKNQINPDGSLQLQAIELPNNQLIHNVQSQFSKFIGNFKTSIGLKLFYTHQSGKSLVNNEIYNTSSSLVDMKPYLDARILTWLNGEYSLSIRDLRTGIVGDQSNRRTFVTNGLNFYTVFRSKHQVSLTSEYYIIENKPVYFVDLKYRYSFTKRRIDIEAGWINIFDAREYISYQSGSYTLFETTYKLRPSQIMVTANFRF